LGPSRDSPPPINPSSTARVRAATDAVDRLVRLQKVTAALARATDFDATAQVLVERALEVVGASLAGLWLIEGTGARLVRAFGAAEARLDPLRNLDLTEPTPHREAMETGKAVLFPSAEAYAAAYPDAAKRARDVGVTGGAAIVPLVHGGRALGCFAFGFASDKPLLNDEQVLLELLAAHGVEALERARAFERERRARARIELLYELASAANRAERIEDVFEPALSAVCRALGVERASILLRDEGGVMRFRAWRGLSEPYRRAVDGHSPWPPDAHDPEPILVEDVLVDPAMESYRPLFARENIRALGFVPLIHERRLLGKFMLYDARPRAFPADDVHIATTIATHIAQAVARQLTEQELHRAKATAEDAARAREDLLAVVAHDLRNPLGAVQLKAVLAGRKLAKGGDDADAVVRDLEAIGRNAEHMARLISDLVDVASIESGRLSVLCAPQPVAQVLHAATDVVRALAEQRGLELELQISHPEARVSCDRERLVQILSNILGNAIKFTPPGGRVTVEAAATNDDTITFAICDTGPGIPKEERERVFERYVRVGAKKQGGGIGLGLFIAKGLVAAHGGRIWIEAAPAGGTRVAFTLPRC
jgi:signal transduction histidine kinase